MATEIIGILETAYLLRNQLFPYCRRIFCFLKRCGNNSNRHSDRTEYLSGQKKPSSEGTSLNDTALCEDYGSGGRF